MSVHKKHSLWHFVTPGILKKRDPSERAHMGWGVQPGVMVSSSTKQCSVRLFHQRKGSSKEETDSSLCSFSDEQASRDRTNWSHWRLNPAGPVAIISVPAGLISSQFLKAARQDSGFAASHLCPKGHMIWPCGAKHSENNKGPRTEPCRTLNQT